MCAAALLIAIAAANLARNIAVDWIYNVVYSDEKYEQDITDMLQSLQDYVQEEQVTEDNIKQLVNWVRKQKNVYVTFYRDIDDTFMDRNLQAMADRAGVSICRMSRCGI